MRLFGRKSTNRRCTDCRYYTMVEGHGYCAKSLPSHINIRLLSQEAIRRQCPRCPDEMTCEHWEAR